jgi:hypothetical protein
MPVNGLHRPTLGYQLGVLGLSVAIVGIESRGLSVLERILLTLSRRPLLAPL